MWKVLFRTTDPAIEEVLALIGGQLEIPKGYSQLRVLYQKAFFQHAPRVLFRSFFLLWKVIILKIFISDRSIILKILIPKGHYSEFRNNDPSE